VPATTTSSALSTGSSLPPATSTSVVPPTVTTHATTPAPPTTDTALPPATVDTPAPPTLVRLPETGAGNVATIALLGGSLVLIGAGLGRTYRRDHKEL
jgi:LPXTG-motif cell wall-anchored protein